MRALMHLETIWSSPITVDIIKHVHKILKIMIHGQMNWSGKNFDLMGEYRTLLTLAGYHIFLPTDAIERIYMKDTMSKFCKA